MHALNIEFRIPIINNFMSSSSSGTLVNAEESKVNVMMRVPH